MKRSKALNKMGMAFVAYLKKEEYTKSPFNIGQIKEITEELLKTLENLGMLPPESLRPATSQDMHAGRTINGNDQVVEHKWEKE